MVLMPKRARSRSNRSVSGLGRDGRALTIAAKALTLRLLTAPARALLKRVHQPRNLHIRTLGTMVKA